MNELFTALIHQPVFNILVLFYRLFGENLGLAIIAIALLSRLVLLPLSIRQNKMVSENQVFSEKVKEIKNKYKKDKKKQQEELMKIQSEYLPSQLAGCLPLIVQFILLITINNVFVSIFTDPSKFSEVFSKFAYVESLNFPSGYTLNTSFLGMDLNVLPSSIGFGTAGILPYIVVILLVGLTQYYSAKLLQPSKKVEQKKEEEKKHKSGEPEDFSEVLQKTTQQTMFLLPIMIMAASYSFATGLSIYWISQSVFLIIQQIVLKRFKKTPVDVSK